MLSLETAEAEDAAELDKIRNCVLLLYTLNELQAYSRVDKWKIQKTCFFTQRDAQMRRIKGTNYQFFKWKDGPMSAGIVGDFNVFNATGMVHLSGNRVFEHISKEGRDLISEMKTFIEASENRTVVDHLAGWVNKLGPYTGSQLRDMSHRCEVPYMGGMAAIEDIADGTPLLDPIGPRDVSFDFRIPKEWIPTLSLTFSFRYPEIKQVLSTPFKAADLLKWSDVFDAH